MQGETLKYKYHYLNVNENHPSVNEGRFILFTSSCHSPQTTLLFFSGKQTNVTQH